MGSDQNDGRKKWPMINFNPRSPHGERLLSGEGAHDHQNFNPRSPHGERPQDLKVTLPIVYFNPRSPHGERPQGLCLIDPTDDFNPRSPHGERHPQSLDVWHLSQFQSTLPAWGATTAHDDWSEVMYISIHAPRMGSDLREKVESASP